MADELKAPVAIRVTRPYATEEEFLEREFDTLTHTSVILLGAQSRPQGVVLRFEIALQSGESILRGEGRVVAYKDKAYAGEAGLTLRFTRLDSRSKSLVDRAVAMREARARGPASTPSVRGNAPPAPSSGQPLVESAPRIPPPLPSQPPPSSRRGPPPLPDWARSQAPPSVTRISTPPPPPAPSSADEIDDIEETHVEPFRAPEVKVPTPPPPAPAKGARSPSARPPIPPSPLRVPSSLPPPPEPPPEPPVDVQSKGAPPSSPLERPFDRDALLQRLRARAQGLPPDRVHDILTKPGARA